MVALLERFFRNCPCEKLDYGQYRYDRSIRFEPVCVQVFFDSDEKRAKRLHGGRLCVSIPGSALDFIGGEKAWELTCALVDECWMKGTRVDCAFDDYRRRILPHQIAEVAERGNFTGFRRWEPVSPRRLGGAREGDQVTFGRRGADGSGRFLAVYDKLLESGGENPAVRWEVRFAKEVARDVVFRLSECRTVEAYTTLLGALVGGSIDFVERTDRAGDKNINRLQRLTWWAELVTELGTIGLCGRTPDRSIPKSKDWIETSVAVTLATLEQAVGQEDFAEWLDEVIRAGRGRMGVRQRGMLQTFWERGFTRWCDEGGVRHVLE